MTRLLIILPVFFAFALPELGMAQSPYDVDRSPTPEKKSNFDWKMYGEKMKAAVARGDLTERQAGEANRLMRFYVDLDANGNQVIEPAEYERSRYRSTIERRIRDAGLEPGRPIALQTFIVKRLTNSGIKTAPIQAVMNAYKPKERERITLDLPASYAEFDSDQDGQIGLYEWPKSQIAEFFEFDLNDDGFATPREIEIVETMRAENAAESN